jgi:hypothetical protein
MVSTYTEHPCSILNLMILKTIKAQSYLIVKSNFHALRSDYTCVLYLYVVISHSLLRVLSLFFPFSRQFIAACVDP